MLNESIYLRNHNKKVTVNIMYVFWMNCADYFLHFKVNKLYKIFGILCIFLTNYYYSEGLAINL